MIMMPKIKLVLKILHDFSLEKRIGMIHNIHLVELNNESSQKILFLQKQPINNILKHLVIQKSKTFKLISILISVWKVELMSQPMLLLDLKTEFGEIDKYILAMYSLDSPSHLVNVFWSMFLYNHLMCIFYVIFTPFVLCHKNLLVFQTYEFYFLKTQLHLI